MRGNFFDGVQKNFKFLDSLKIQNFWNVILPSRAKI